MSYSGLSLLAPAPHILHLLGGHLSQSTSMQGCVSNVDRSWVAVKALAWRYGQLCRLRSVARAEGILQYTCQVVCVLFPVHLYAKPNVRIDLYFITRSGDRTRNVLETLHNFGSYLRLVYDTLQGGKTFHSTRWVSLAELRNCWSLKRYLTSARKIISS